MNIGETLGSNSNGARAWARGLIFGISICATVTLGLATYVGKRAIDSMDAQAEKLDKVATIVVGMNAHSEEVDRRISALADQTRSLGVDARTASSIVWDGISKITDRVSRMEGILDRATAPPPVSERRRDR